MTARFVALTGVVVGLAAGFAYWLAAQLWPTSIAVVVSMIASAVFTANSRFAGQQRVAAAAATDARHGGFWAPYWVFALLIKYNALMALSAANVPFPLPAYLTLALIMIAGHSASWALMVSATAADASAIIRVSANDLTIALLVGLAPATLLGIPGLIGLATAIVMGLALSRGVLPKLHLAARERLTMTQHATEVSFYLGALAAWKYI